MFLFSQGNVPNVTVLLTIVPLTEIVPQINTGGTVGADGAVASVRRHVAGKPYVSAKHL
jgi:hypothetical protein